MAAGRDSRVGQAYLLFGISLLLVVSVGFAAQAVFPRAGLAFTEVVLILLPALWFVRRKQLPLARALKLAPVSGFTALMAVSVGVAGWGVAVLIHAVLAGGLTAPFTTAPPRLDAAGWAAMLLVGALLPGVCEEVLFRGAIMGVLERRGTGYAVTVAAVLFGVYHISPATAVPAVFLGLVFGLLVARTGSLLPAILAHTANNATGIAVGHTPAASLVTAGILATAFLPLALVLWARTRHVGAPGSPLAAVPAAASVKSPLRLAAWTSVALILAVSVLAASMINVHRVRDAELEPDLRAGDLAVVAIDASRQRLLRAGDIVELDHEADSGRPGRKLGRVLEVADGRLLVEAGSTRVEVARDRVIGKVVYSRRR